MAETLKELLETVGREDDMDYGRELVRSLCDEFNFFGSYQTKMKTLNDSLNDKGKNTLRALICIAALEMAKAYKSRGGCWDDRKKASEEFAYSNITVFEDEFRKITGFAPEASQGYDPLGLDRMQFQTAGYAYLYNAVRAWANAHSTLKQAVFGGYVRGVMALEAGYERFEEARFPFI